MDISANSLLELRKFVAPEFVFGMAHGIGWIVMSLVCIVAVRLHVISLRLAEFMSQVTLYTVLGGGE